MNELNDDDDDDDGGGDGDDGDTFIPHSSRQGDR